MRGPKELLTQHLAASVYAPGYDGMVVDWSVNRRHEEKAINGVVRTTELSVPNSSIKVSLNGSGVTTEASIGETRERLVYSDYVSHANKLTTVANLHQVGAMKSEFQYYNAVRNYMSVSTKRESQGGFSITGSVETGKTSTATVSWSLPATTSDTQYRTRVCQTYFDYRVEEFYIEEWRDRGDGKLDWVKIDSYMKVYCNGVSNNPTPAGPPIQTTSAPPSDGTWFDYAPHGGSDWTKSVTQNIEGAASFNVFGMPVKVNVGHNATTSERWRFENTSSSKYYQGRYVAGEWRLRLKP